MIKGLKICGVSDPKTLNYILNHNYKPMIKGLKICGVSDPETLSYILNHIHKPIMIGFITNYKKSKRFVE